MTDGPCRPDHPRATLWLMTADRFRPEMPGSQMHISHSAIIRRTPPVVFSWIADPAKAAQWQPDVVDYEITSQTADVVGTTFREQLGDEGRSMQMHGRVIAFDPGRQIAFDLRGAGIGVTSKYSVSPHGDATDIVVDLDVRVLGPLTRVLGPFLRPRLERRLTADVERLRVMCESADLSASSSEARRTIRPVLAV
jgi:uncharacterized protein YndB with AHSA1/START domain